MKQLKWISSVMILLVLGITPEGGQIVRPMEEIDNVSGLEILAAVDQFLAEQASDEKWRSLRRAPVTNIEDFSTIPADLPSGMKNVWRNTVMIFGGTADGLGIGTGVLMKNLENHEMVVFSAYHVVDEFCSVPREEVRGDGQGIECKMLFALNDIAIDTESKKVSADGLEPWKAPIRSLLYYDKVADFAAFKIELPQAFKAADLPFHYAFNSRNPYLPRKEIEFNGRNRIADRILARDWVKLKYFQLYSVSYPSTYLRQGGEAVHQKQLIQKRWTKGGYIDSFAYEAPNRHGFARVFKHSLPMLPGASGGALSLSDGRVFALNVALVMNKRYVRRYGGCTPTVQMEEMRIAMPLANVSSYVQDLQSLPEPQAPIITDDEDGVRED